MVSCGDQHLTHNYPQKHHACMWVGLNEQHNSEAANTKTHTFPTAGGVLPRPSAALKLAGYKGQRLRRPRD